MLFLITIFMCKQATSEMEMELGAGVLFGFLNEERGNVAFACATRQHYVPPALLFILFFVPEYRHPIQLFSSFWAGPSTFQILDFMHGLLKYLCSFII